MTQPELGLKIAELRKAKGLTQEELVEKCNLNVRTLQRIESGKVTPRNYTIKLIFTALDFNQDNSSENNENELNKEKFTFMKQLGLLYKHLNNILNLKTNANKKIAFLATLLFMLSAITFVLITVLPRKNGQKGNYDVHKNLEKDNTQPVEDREMIFSSFFCGNCFDDDDELIGRDVRFMSNGVMIKLGLIKLNKRTREFKAGMIQGKILQSKVELSCPKEIVNDKTVDFGADHIEQSDSIIILRGNAKIASQNDSIVANEIIISIK